MGFLFIGNWQSGGIKFINITIPLPGRTMIRFIFSLLLAVDLHISAAVPRSCPLFCECSPDTAAHEEGLKADCRYDLQIIPRLSRNITWLKIETKHLTSLEDFAFADAPFLTHVTLYVDSLNKINRSAFGRLGILNAVTLRSKAAVTIESGAFCSKTLTSLNVRGVLKRLPPEICNAPKLRTLDVDKNAITSVRFLPCVEELVDLYSVSLSNNPLRTVNGSDFYHLRNINFTELHLSQCGLTWLPSDLLRYLPFLKKFDLSGNKIAYLPGDLFRHTRYMRQLDLSQTLLQGTPLQNNPAIIKTLSNLVLSGCKRMNISFNSQFLNATNLQALEIEDNVISRLVDSTFTSLSRSPIATMSLQASGIRRVEAGSLQSLGHLRELNMLQNPMTEEAIHNTSVGTANSLKVVRFGEFHKIHIVLNNNTFGGFSLLSELYLQGIDSLKITRNSFSSLQKLTKLFLSGNRLTLDDLEQDAFEGLCSLQDLYLDHNLLMAIPRARTVGTLPSLQHLYLTNNAIVSVGSEDFLGYEGLTVLNLQNNKLETLLTGTFERLQNLTDLRLNGNMISSIKIDAFKKLSKLTFLTLDKNRLSGIASPSETLSFQMLQTLTLNTNSDLKRLEAEMFSQIPKLTFLELASCKIIELPLGIFANNSHLTFLVLSHNAIATWDWKVFQPLAALEQLMLNDNQITSINKMSFVYLESLRTLNLARNPLACNCDLLWFKHWVNDVEVYLMEYGNIESYTCFSPDDMKGVPLHKFSLSPVDCSSRQVLHLVIGLTVVLVFLWTLATLVYRYRWYLRYYVFLLRSRRRQQRDALLNAEAFQYDVYACYHNSSRRWVIDHLVPELEDNGGLRLCLHDRDWFPGRKIMDNVVESMESNRKILLLVNNGFASSAWCREETGLAHNRMMEEQCNLLVVVLLEDIEQENMDSTMRSLLASRTYLAWAAGGKKEARFWKALRRALRREEHPGAGVEMHTAAEPEIRRA